MTKRKSWSRMFPVRWRWILIPTVLWLVAPAPGTAAEKIRVAASLADLGWLVERVGGPEVEVSVLCPGGRDPHGLPAKPSLSRRLKNADLLVYNGLELEVGWLPVLLRTARNSRLRPGGTGALDCSEAIPHLLEVVEGELDRSGGDVHPEGNPHYLLDPRNGVAVADLIAERLARIRPEAADVFRTRAAEFAGEIDERAAGWRDRLTRLEIERVIVYHQQWEYLLDWLGWEVLGAIENRPGISPAPRHLQEIVRLGAERRPVVVLAATWDHLHGAENVAEKIDAGLAVLPASVDAVDEASGYPNLFATIVQRIEEAAR